MKNIKQKKVNQNNVEPYKSDQLRIVTCTLFFSYGLMLFIPSSVMIILGGTGVEGLWASIIIMLFSIIGFIYPSNYKNGYLIGTSVTITAAIVILIIYFSFVPQMKELAENYEDADATSSISGLQPGDTDFVFIENIYFGLIIILIAASIFLIYQYYRADQLEKKSILEAKYL